MRFHPFARRLAAGLCLVAMAALDANAAFAEGTTVPDVRGLDMVAAAAELRQAGLHVADYEYLSLDVLRQTLGRDYTPGVVVQQAPPPGESAAPGSLVHLRIAGAARSVSDAPARIAPPVEPLGAVRSAPLGPPPPRPPPPYDLGGSNPTSLAAAPPLRIAPAIPPTSVAQVALTQSIPAPGATPTPRAPCLRRWDLRVEGALGLLRAPRGALGGIETGRSDQLRWDTLDYDRVPFERIRFRVSARYAWDARQSLQLQGGWLASLKDTGSAAGIFAFFPGPGGAGGVSPSNEAVLTSEAELYGAELNYIRDLCSTCGFRTEVLAGARYLAFNEKASASDWAAPFPGVAGPQYVNGDVRNGFLAGQLGAALQWDLGRRTELRTTAKGMVGFMSSDVRVSDQAFYAPGPHTASLDASGLAFGGEVEISLRFALSQSIGLTLGYDVLIVDGIVRAHDAMDFTQSTTGAVQAADRQDTLVAHVFLLGLSIRL